MNEKKEPSRLKTLWHFIQDIGLIFSLAKDYWNGNYRDVSWTTIFFAVIAFLYMVSPVDLMTDMVPVIGWLDDVVIIVLFLKFFHHDLEKYKHFKEEEKKRVEK